MSLGEIWTIISGMMTPIITIIAILILRSNKKKEKAAIRNTILTQLKCKKDEMDKKERKIYTLIDFYKKKVIKKKEFQMEIVREFEQLKLVYDEYKKIKSQLTVDELKNEKEDYARNIEHIETLWHSMTGGK